MRKTFSVIVPLYNKGTMVGRSISSVLAQTYQDFELIIVDDGSTDNSRQIAESYLGDIRVKLIAQKNKGVSAARNRGLKEAKGDYIAFLDADDEWLPYYLETVLFEALKFPKAGLISVPALHRDIKTGFGVFFTVMGFANKSLIVDVFRSDRFLAQTSGIVVRGSVFRQFMSDVMDGFPEDMTYEEDMVTFFSFALANDILYVCKPMSVRNINVEGQLVSVKKPKILLESQSRYLNRLMANYLKVSSKSIYFLRFFDYELRTRIVGGIVNGVLEEFLNSLSGDVLGRLSVLEIGVYKSRILPSSFKVLVTKFLRLPYYLQRTSYKYGV